MRLGIKIYFFIGLLFLCLQTEASHIFGGELNYKHLNGNTYEITLTLYGDCSGQSFPNLPNSVPVIKIYNGLNAFSSITLLPFGIVGEEVTPVCPDQINNTSCKGGLLPGVARFIFKGNVTLNANSADWQFIFNGELGGNNQAGRSGAITNITQGAGYTIMKLVATLNNTLAQNNSSTYTTIPTPFFCINNAQQYNQGAIDADGDLLSFNLISGLDGNGNQVNYTPPYTPADPLGYVPGSFNFSNATGQLSFTPNTVQNALVVSQVTETRGGIVVGTSMREMVFVVLGNCNNQSPNGVISTNNAGVITNGNEITICNATTQLQFDINPIDPDNGKILVNYSGLPPGAVMSINNNNTSNPNLQFSWTIPPSLPLGDYTFYVTYQDDDCPLSSKQTIAYTIHYIQPILANITSTAETCVPASDGTINIMATSINGGFTYALNANPFQNNALYTGLLASTYTVTIKDNKNCTYTTTVQVSLPTYPVFDSIIVQDIKCNGGTDGSIKVKVSPLNAYYTYQLFPDNIITTSPIFNNLIEKTYTIIVADTNGCKDTAVASIVEPDKLAFGDIDITPLSCEKINGKIQVRTNFNNNIRYKLIPTSNPVDTSGFFDNLTTGFYTIVARNANDCVIDTVIYVGEIPKSFFISTTHTDLPCWGRGDEGEAEAILTGGVNPITVLWSSTPTQTTPKATQLTYGYYFVTAIDAKGCEVKDTMYIAPGNCCENIFFPNAFSPNADQLNDSWGMVTSTGLEIEQFAVFDRWGQKVWFTRDPREKWNGLINQSEAALGTYFYLLRYKCLSDDKHYTKTGDFILVK